MIGWRRIGRGRKIVILALLGAMALMIGMFVAYAAAKAWYDGKLAERDRLSTEVLAQGLVTRSETISPPDVIVIGNSILGAVGTDCGNSFHLTVPGILAEDMVDPARAVLRRFQPRAVIVGLGTNDLRAGLDPRAALKAIYDLPGHKIILGVPNSPALARWQQAESQRRGYQFIPFSFPTGDGIHPDHQGRFQLSDAIAAACRAPDRSV